MGEVNLRSRLHGDILIKILMVRFLGGSITFDNLETFSTSVFALTANRKRQIQVRRLAFDVYHLYRFSYKISLGDAAILNFQTKAAFYFQMAARNMYL